MLLFLLNPDGYLIKNLGKKVLLKILTSYKCSKQKLVSIFSNQHTRAFEFFLPQ